VAKGIDDGLLRAAMRASGVPTKKAAVEAACACWFKRAIDCLIALSV
jgi:Arc/MetJ family transcription regulator